MDSSARNQFTPDVGPDNPTRLLDGMKFKWRLKRGSAIKTFGSKNSLKICCQQLSVDVKMEIPVLVRSLKSSSVSVQLDKTFWGVASAAVEQSRHKSNMVAQEDWKFGP